MNNVIITNTLSSVVRRVRIIVHTKYGKGVYYPTESESVVLTVYDSEGNEHNERECEIKDGEIIAEFPIFNHDGIYKYKISLYTDKNTRFTFINSEIIVGRSNTSS